VLEPHGAVVKIDPADGTEEARVLAPGRYGDPFALTVGEGAVWTQMLLTHGAELWRIDPGGDVVAKIPFADPARLDAAGGFVWVATMNRQSLQLEVRRFDPVVGNFVGGPLVVPRYSNAAAIHFNCRNLGAPDVPGLVVEGVALWLTSTCDGEVVRVQL
jgi:hypothetical protein